MNKFLTVSDFQIPFPGPSRKMVDSKSGVGNVQDELGLYCDTDRKKLLNSTRIVPAGFRSQHEVILTGQRWSNWESKKIIVAMNGNRKVHINYYMY